MFDSIWDAAAVQLDTAVDSVLGDRLRYRRGGAWLGDPAVGPETRTIAGFVKFEVSGLTLDPVDDTFGSRPRVKVAKALVPRPDRSDRIVHPKLGEGLFQPGGGEPETDGRYWIFDVQAASA